MLDIKLLREQPDVVRDSIRKRGISLDVDDLLRLDEQRLELMKSSEALRAQLKIDGKPSPEQLQQLQALRADFDRESEKLKQVEQQFNDLMMQLPNVLADDTPIGGEEANRIDRTVGEPTKFSFEPKDHMQLSEIHDLVNFEAGAKVAGNKFYFLRPKAVRLWQAIEQLAQDMAEQAGHQTMLVPELVNEKVAVGTGYLPKGEEADNYHDREQGLVLIATSELPLTAYHMDEIIDVASPVRYGGLSTCYRLEGSAYGKFAKGLYRVHQFEKLEMYSFTTAEESDAELQRILSTEEKIVQSLEIPYHVSRTASGDMSAPAYEKYDLEYYSPVDQSYRELTSCSNCTDFQSRRLNIRYRDKDGRLRHVHTLNGTAVNSTRTLIALLENHQTKDGEVKIPQALQEYYGKETL
ncbi:serine--tRNA ligase [bacterium]|nr:serine--tRNA ligase [bacterium]